tara:strand:+ start:16245 stop:16553 length:309 start_codon:yes stop_codon:yes gene_type:complete
MEALTLAVAVEAGPHNIRVNTLLPGIIDTDMFRSLDGGSIIAALSAPTPLKRIGRPQDIGNVAAWLASDDASFITGQSPPGMAASPSPACARHCETGSGSCK